MKYLTENDLRIAYRDIPFEVFTIRSNEKLTPGARTFLSDRKIKIIDDNDSKARSQVNHYSGRGQPQASSVSFVPNDFELLAVRCDMLSAAQILCGLDIAIAEELKLLERYLSTPSGTVDITSFTFFQNLKEVDQTGLVEQLSNVGLFINTQKGEILLKLYPIYFSLLAYAEKSRDSDDIRFVTTLSRLGNLISYYLGKEERETDEPQ
ncbi:hypothetical protein C1M49_02470 [Streptococcus intermedius]|uniref:hypothetical protein n=1 Tax=Streptococcus intermedius TaxID=1338 RepID=UPI000C843DD8|nr:hypothetical protein [Streptococcus intermedius]PMR92941.1 hypothetical protein C1M49_02470 [Streptococcus intermedius]